ncbi:uncharacterized protein LOC117893510 [Drosophila subobscura]|uniref:uncharacterized protein LOC117893510 n=1 Tax=Drosophila subobscura TaxID=7241 RepID=UPI00155A6146|nr:uncharacterized protein LOC117893510 [Drosophila subobscura]
MESSRKDVYIPIVLAVMAAYSRPVPLDEIVDGVMELLSSLRDPIDFEGATGRKISGIRK